MKFRPTIALLLIAAAPAALPATAWARPNPQPKPSGIVIHLFGRHSITSHILPQGAEPAGPDAAPVMHVAGPASPPGPSAANDDTGPRSGIEPSPAEQGPNAGNILHELFVSGDPDLKPGQALSVGRGNDQQYANAPNGKPAASGQ